MLELQPVRRVRTQYLVKIALLSAVASVIMFFEFMIPVMPVFLKMDFSEVPVLLGTFALGPVAGILIELIKNIVHVFYTHTYGVGEIANFVVGCAYVVPAGIIYRRMKNKKGACLALITGTISMTLVAGFMNYFVFVPLYQFVLNWPLDAIIELGTIANPMIVDLKTLIVVGIVPFNVIKGMAIGIITLLVYKKVSPVLHQYTNLND